MSHSLWRFPLMSTLAVILTVVLSTAAARAHELVPSVADLGVNDARVTLEVALNAEAILSGIDQTAHDDSADAPAAPEYDRLRALDPDALATLLTEAWPAISEGITLNADQSPLTIDLKGIASEEVGDTDLARTTVVTMAAALAQDSQTLTLGWIAQYGPIVVRQIGVEEPYTGYLTNGALSDPIPIEGGGSSSVLEVLGEYIVIGFEHIVPKGLDHILFVLGLFFFSTQMRPLIWQVTAFTLAHTVTLALGILGLVTIPASVVEPLIAASIVYVGVENVLSKGHSRWRPLIVFGFGLLHGLGFASVLSGIGLNPSTFVTGLIGFNVGVELGQLAVIAAAYLAVGYWFGGKPWYRNVIAVPASIAISVVGAWWFIERVFL